LALATTQKQNLDILAISEQNKNLSDVEMW